VYLAEIRRFGWPNEWSQWNSGVYAHSSRPAIVKKGSIGTQRRRPLGRLFNI
jgi:hypothetical protein